MEPPERWRRWRRAMPPLRGHPTRRDGAGRGAAGGTPPPTGGSAAPQPSGCPQRTPRPQGAPPWDGVKQGLPGSANRNQIRVSRRGKRGAPELSRERLHPAETLAWFCFSSLFIYLFILYLFVCRPGKRLEPQLVVFAPREAIISGSPLVSYGEGAKPSLVPPPTPRSWLL